mgnify:FL=1
MLKIEEFSKLQGIKVISLAITPLTLTNSKEWRKE